MFEGDVTLWPRWKHAVHAFVQAGFPYGSVVTHSWLEESLGLPRISDNTKMSPREFKDRQLQFLQGFEQFRRQLLEQEQIHLESVHGQGYRVTPPGEQTAVVTDRFEHDMRRSFRTTALRLKHIRIAELTDGQRRENLDASARLATLGGMIRRIE
jgi:hypothetical protein